MVKRFEILFLEEVFEFLTSLEKKHYEKILYNIRKSQIESNPELLKKLSNDIWEFRTNYNDFNNGFLLFGTKLLTSIRS